MISIRDELPADLAAIEAVTIEAFGTAEHSSGTEQFIVRALRDSGQLAVSLVAEEDGRILGHVAVSPVTISTGWYGLGPVSVVPGRQGKGIGTMLITRALAELRASGQSAASCLVSPVTTHVLVSRWNQGSCCRMFRPSTSRPSYSTAHFLLARLLIMRLSRPRREFNLEVQPSIKRLILCRSRWLRPG